jgi:hypothetical protein
MRPLCVAVLTRFRSLSRRCSGCSWEDPSTASAFSHTLHPMRSLSCLGRQPEGGRDCLEVLPLRPPVITRTQTVAILEAAGEMSLAGEAAAIGDHADRQVGAGRVGQPLSGRLQAAIRDVVGDVPAALVEQFLRVALRGSPSPGKGTCRLYQQSEKTPSPDR